VAQLNEVLKKRFGKTLPPRGEKQKRTIIQVEDGVGYDIALFSDWPEESEILVEAGTQLEVLANDLNVWKPFGEEEYSNRQQLRTRMLRMVPLLTGGPGSLVRRYVDKQIEDREQCEAFMEAFMAFQKLKRTGGCLSDLPPETFSQLQKVIGELEQLPSTSKGGLVTRSATRSEDQKAQTLIKQLWEEAHDFDGACDWLLQVTVKQHEGKDDTVGERIDASKVQTVKNYRLYSVDPGQLLKVTVRNLSLVRTISFTPVYVDCEGDDDPEEAHTLIMLKSGESQELPMALKKDREEKDDGWDLRDAEGTKTLLRLRFTVAQPT
jgi:hypothetical protein